MKKTLIILTLPLFIGFSACSDEDEPASNVPNEQPQPNDPVDIVSLAQDQSNLTTLVDLVSNAGLAPTLADESVKLTVFAPTDEAFAAATLPTDSSLVENILLHHVVEGDLDSTTLLASTAPYTTFAKTEIGIDADAGTIGGAVLSSTLDVEASNGVVHVLDAVMIPPTILEAAQGTDSLSTLASAVGNAPQTVVDTLGGDGPITVFAPVNSAFEGIDLDTLDAAAIGNILTYHVVSGQFLEAEIPGSPVQTAQGQSITINATAKTITDSMGNVVNIVATDLRLLNGVVHLIDGVLMPTPQDDPQNIVEIAEQTPELSQLVTLVNTARLADALAAAEPRKTVFAPTTAAFLAADDIMPTDPGLVANVLLHHTLEGRFDSAAVTGATDFNTLAQTTVLVEGTTIGGAALNTDNLDIEASNGIIHLLDAVMVPPTIAEAAMADPQLSDLVAAVGAASPDVLATLSGPGPITVFAPVNTAFEGLDLSSLTSDEVTNVLTYHVVTGQVLASDIPSGQPITAANGDAFSIDTSGDAPVITDAMDNRATIVATDVRLLNGVVHLIDSVLMPEPEAVPNLLDTVMSIPELSSLAQLVENADLDTALADETANLTVFAPTDAAIQAVMQDLPTNQDLVANLILHHVAPGRFDSVAVTSTQALDTLALTSIAVDGTTIGGAALDLANLDITASNGIVHLLDDVMLPPTVLEAAVASPDLGNLEIAVVNADTSVADVLSGPGPITVFAPVDSGWGTINPAELEDAAGILTYHVVAGQVLAADIVSGQPITTENGATFTIDTSGPSPTITDMQGGTVNIIGTDLRLRNGVVHFIDGVLFP